MFSLHSFFCVSQKTTSHSNTQQEAHNFIFIQPSSQMYHHIMNTTIPPEYYNMIVARGRRLPYTVIKSQRSQRLKFALFIKILFKRLEDSGETALRDNAKQILLELTERSKGGDPACLPLLDKLEIYLRELVGEIHWRRAHGYMRYYIARNGGFLLPSSKKRGFHELAHSA